MIGGLQDQERWVYIVNKHVIAPWHGLITTSAEKVIFLLASVCLSVCLPGCLSVSKITQYQIQNNDIWLNDLPLQRSALSGYFLRSCIVSGHVLSVYV